ncbi:hypothetical protein AMK30_32420 [Streptomyces sp. CB02460]|nr:hypothetical protein AMK30_32420 [Streptomyces sp. CB02460]
MLDSRFLGCLGLGPFPGAILGLARVERTRELLGLGADFPGLATESPGEVRDPLGADLDPRPQACIPNLTFPVPPGLIETAAQGFHRGRGQRGLAQHVTTAGGQVGVEPLDLRGMAPLTLLKPPQQVTSRSLPGFGPLTGLRVPAHIRCVYR